MFFCGVESVRSIVEGMDFFSCCPKSAPNLHASRAYRNV
jgi:hypothetical protein